MDSLSSVIIASLGMALAGTIIAAIGWGANYIYQAWKRRRTVSLRLADVNGQKAWRWFVAWLSAPDASVKRVMVRGCQHVRLRAATGKPYAFMPNDMVEPMRFTYKGQHFSAITRDEATHRVAGKNGNISDPSCLSATIWTSGRDVNVFRELLTEMKGAFVREQAALVAIWSPLSEHPSYWQQVRTTERRPFALVMHARLRDDLLHDVNTFTMVETRKMYARIGTPYRRSWLLHGPPGNGKSSCAIAIACHLGADLNLLSLSNPKLDDSGLAHLVNDTTPIGDDDGISVIVLEDVDVLFGDRATAPSPPGQVARPQSAVTLSGLLNVLDGPVAPEKTLFILTTNYPERLDSALTRPGRVDRWFEFGPPTPDLIRDMYVRFHEGVARTDAIVDDFVARCQAEPAPLCLARVQELARFVAPDDIKV